MLLVGFVKCGEKTCALYSASIDASLDKLISRLYPKESSNEPRAQISAKLEDFFENLLEMDSKDHIKEMHPRDLYQNFIFFFVSLFVDFVLSYDYLQKHQSNFRNYDLEYAFRFVEVQLAYAFDVFYTKAYVLFGSPFPILGNIILLNLGVIICYRVFVTNKLDVSKLDHIITWILLVGTVVLDSLSGSVHSFDGWIKARLRSVQGDGQDHVLSFFKNQLRSVLGDDLDHVLSFFGWFKNQLRSVPEDGPDHVLSIFGWFENDTRWSNEIRQGNLLALCLQHNNMTGKFNKLHKLLQTRPCQVDEHLKEYVFHSFKEKSESLMHEHSSSKPGVDDVSDSSHGDGFKSMEWTKRLEFHQRILTWHIATDICYYLIRDIQEQGRKPAADSETKVTISKTLSDYMLYILVKQRQMLPVGTGLISFGDTCVETMKFLQLSETEAPSLESDNKLHEACKKMINPDAMKKNRSNSSVLFDACRLAHTLTNEIETEQRWGLLASVWVEILLYGATHCRVDQHAQQLRKGGEFLTHVWLLSAHLGLVDQFRLTPTPAEEEQALDQMKESENGNTDERVGTPEDRIATEEDIEEGSIP